MTVMRFFSLDRVPPVPLCRTPNRRSNTRPRQRNVRLAVLAMLPMLAGCIEVPGDVDPVPPAPGPAFDAFAFFTGRSAGEGELATLFSDPVPIRVESEGRMEGEVLVLDQRIRQGDKPARTRQWRLEQTGPMRWEGSLTDADGRVVTSASGNALTIDYPMEDGLQVHQRLTLAPDGSRAHNRMTVRALGLLVVARLEEDIRRLPAGETPDAPDQGVSSPSSRPSQ